MKILKWVCSRFHKKSNRLYKDNKGTYIICLECGNKFYKITYD